MFLLRRIDGFGRLLDVRPSVIRRGKSFKASEHITYSYIDYVQCIRIHIRIYVASDRVGMYLVAFFFVGQGGASSKVRCRESDLNCYCGGRNARTTRR